MSLITAKFYKYLKEFIIFCGIPLCLVFSTCAKDSQFSSKLVASPFVSELFGSTTKTIAIDTEGASHIAWMGLEWAGDYKYYQIDQVSVNGRLITPETVGPNALLENISVTPETNTNAGILNNTTDGQLLIRVTYKPNVAVETEEDRHTAYLLVAYDEPEAGTVRIELNGYTQGIAENKCAGAASGTQVPYAFQNGQFDFYLCADSPLVIENDPEGRDNVNFAEVPVTGDFIFYQPDDETLCILGASDGVTATIPPFDVDVPDEAESPIDPIGVELVDNSLAECTLADGGITCDGTIEVGVAGIATVKLSATTGSVTPTSSVCDSIGTVTGSGGYPGAMTIIAYGDLGANSLLAPYEIEFAVVVAVINLEPKE